MTSRTLADLLEVSSTHHADRLAVVDVDGEGVTYADLNRQAGALAAFLTGCGVQEGDRVGVVLPKGIQAVAALFGIMKAGAAYVPLDYSAPVGRNRQILADCQVRAVIVDSRAVGVVPKGEPGGSLLRAVLVAGPPIDLTAIRVPATRLESALAGNIQPATVVGRTADLAYILYTSGSTGTPKGVMITHESALALLDWCSSEFQPTEHDRFSSHVPFHFDPSVLDLYLAIKHGATVYLISTDLARSPEALARFIVEQRLTVWNSTPSILGLLERFGNLSAQPAPSLRLVLFGGEVFPVKHLRQLQRVWPSPAYYNLYGPTETTVMCTYARIPSAIPDDRDEPYPIGFPCGHFEAVVLDDHGKAGPGQEGLLHVRGRSVFRGYWGRPAETAAAFVEHNGRRWYNTGDVVRWTPEEGFTFVGRRDRMVKRRGYRIELGEIERALYTHPSVREAAVVSFAQGQGGLAIVAFLACQPGKSISTVELKSFCASRLPVFMSPDRFVIQERLPRTSTDKVDYQGLLSQVAHLRVA